MHLRDESEHMPSITCCQVGQNGVSDKSAHRQSDQEFVHRILHGSRGQKERNHGRRGRQQGGNGDRAKTPSTKDLVTLLELPAWDLACERFLSSFASKPVCNIPSYHRTNGRHHSVI